MLTFLNVAYHLPPIQRRTFGIDDGKLSILMDQLSKLEDDVQYNHRKLAGVLKVMPPEEYEIADYSCPTFSAVMPIPESDEMMILRGKTKLVDGNYVPIINSICLGKLNLKNVFITHRAPVNNYTSMVVTPQSLLAAARGESFPEIAPDVWNVTPAYYGKGGHLLKEVGRLAAGLEPKVPVPNFLTSEFLDAVTLEITEQLSIVEVGVFGQRHTTHTYEDIGLTVNNRYLISSGHVNTATYIGERVLPVRVRNVGDLEYLGSRISDFVKLCSKFTPTQVGA